MRHYVFVGLGSAVGGMARYFLVSASFSIFGPEFPAGTLLANVAGSAIIGVISGLARAESRYVISPEARSLLAIGFCGGFTTYSFFAWQTLMLAGTAPLAAIAYSGLSLALSLIAVFFAYSSTVLVLARRF